MMKNNKIYILLFFLTIISFYSCKKDETVKAPILIDHTSTALSSVPLEWINTAKNNLHIAYGHTSYGSQIVTGMEGLGTWKGDPYLINNGEVDGSLDFRNAILSGDLGQKGDISWAESTRSYLGDLRNEVINVIIWSWGDGVSDNTEAGITAYLNEMSKLESEYPGVKFVYMTGHLDGTGVAGNLNNRNEQIRKFCKENNKILYDFADIESYDPNGAYFLDKMADAACNYDSDNDGTADANWATEWQNTHAEDVDWFTCTAENSEPVNANMKAYAAWWLWARLSGWSGK